MKKKKIAIEIVLWLLLVCLCHTVQAEPMSTSFTFQGQITDDGKPANGEYDLNFRLFDDPNAGSQIGTTIHFEDMRVEQGSLTVELDFVSDDPNAFNGDARWLEISLRRGNSTDPGDYVTISPRMEITPVPYALYAVKAEAIIGGTTNFIPKFLHGNKLGNSVMYESAGNIGVGTTSPKSGLHVNGSYYFLGGSGDVTGNGSVSGFDASYIMQYLNGGRSFTKQEYAKADINGDGRIDTLDAELVAKIAVGSITLDEAHHNVGKFISDVAINIDYESNIGIGTYKPDEKLHVVGRVKIVDGSQGEGKVLTSDPNGVARWKDPSAFGLPQGVIVMWYGSIADIPNGWALCDGTNGTPNLTDRFIVGAGNSYNPGKQGGSNTHAHNAGSLTASSHTHTYSGTTSTFGWNVRREGDQWDSGSTGTHSHSYSGTTNVGGGGSIFGTSDSASCLPPYYALAYIMKI